MALAAIASAGFGMDVSGGTNESLQRPRSTTPVAKRFHLVDEFFAPTKTKAFLNGEQAGLLHNLVKASIFDESEPRKWRCRTQGTVERRNTRKTFIYYLAGHGMKRS